MAYVLDANVFIMAKNLHYGFDFCPAFWEWLEAKEAERSVFSIESVGDELTAGTDELAGWATSRSRFFRKIDPSWLPALRSVSLWTSAAGYEPSAVSTFFQGADYYVVATALATGATVVTHEVPSATKKRVKIPDICIGLSVKCVTPFQMLRNERARFVLGSAAHSPEASQGDP